MSILREIVERQHAVFNARDIEAWTDGFADDVVLVVEGSAMHGIDVLRHYLLDLLEDHPDLHTALERVIATRDDAILVEARVIDTPRAEDRLHLSGMTCESYVVRDGRVVAGHISFAPDDAERAVAAPFAATARAAHEQVALRRIATLAARDVDSGDVLGAVTEELAGLVDADPVAMLRFVGDDEVELVGAWSARELSFPVGQRQPLDDRLRSVRDAGAPVSYHAAQPPSAGPFAAEAREHGTRSSVAVPIEVEGRVWGATVAASTRPEPFPPDTAARIARFTELVAVAIASRQTRSQLRQLADEQTALRHVAELVARDVAPEAVFATVAQELHNLLGGTATLYRYDPDDVATCVAAWEVGGESGVLGDSAVPPPETVTAMVRSTGEPARIDHVGPVPGVFGERRRLLGTRHVTGGPVTVQGRVWGVLVLGFAQPDPPAPDTEVRIARFAELVAATIANAEARADLQALVDEQRALRRVATLVANEAPPSAVFDAVVQETSWLLSAEFVVLLRGEPDCTSVVVAVRGAPPELEPGVTLSADGDGFAPRVLRTGRAARIDDYTEVAGDDAARARRMGIRAGVGAPIFVAGRVWGLIAVASPDDPLPAGTEQRLEQFAELVGTAIGNAETRAELTASRARIVAAADEARRRLQRDVHDGAQQRLVHAVVTLKLARSALGDADGRVAALLDESLENADLANAELRDLARGIMPAVLSHQGLRAAIESLVDRVALPVSLDVTGRRLPVGVETTAYFIVSEALTNAVKHACASRAEVSAVVDGEVLRIAVRDDGIGGVDPSRGSGVVGLTDRVAAVGGQLEISSPPGDGTELIAELPIETVGSPRERAREDSNL